MSRLDLIQVRRDYAASWTVVNPILDDGEPGYEIDTRKIKLGDGVSRWNELSYNFEHMLSLGDVEDAVGFSFGTLAARSSIAALDISDSSANGRSLITAVNYAAMKVLLAYVKGDVGLALVDNTADTSKPVSTLQAAADAVVAAGAASALSTHTSNVSNPHSVTKSQVGLGSVDNTADTDKPVSTAQATADGLRVLKAGDTMTGALTLPGNPVNPLEAAPKQYVDQIIASQDAMVFKGLIDCSTDPNYPAADRGWTYRVSVAGKIGGASGLNVENGDLVICGTDGTATGTHAAVGAAWGVIQTNLDGGVIGPASATDATPVVFDGATGKLIKNVTFASFKTSLVLVKADVGLGSVDNVADASKPVSTLQAAADAAVQAAAIQRANHTGTQAPSTLAAVAANVFLARAAATAGAVSEVALAASQLAGRGASGDIAPIILGTNLSMSGTTLNATGGGGSSKLVSRAYGEYLTNANLTTNIPLDDTIPQNTEGTEILNVSITPSSVTNRVRATFTGYISGGPSVEQHAIAALFKDSVASALAATATKLSDTSNTYSVCNGNATSHIASTRQIQLVFEHVPGVTSAVAYKIRVGGSGGTVRMNGSSTARYFGGVASATLVLEEITP